MQLLEVLTRIDEGIAQLTQLSYSNQTNLPNSQMQTNVSNLRIAGDGARRLLEVPSLQALAQQFLKHQFVTSTYQDSLFLQGTAAQFEALVSARDQLVRAATVIRDFLKESLASRLQSSGGRFEVRLGGELTTSELLTKLELVERVLQDVAYIARVGGLTEEQEQFVVAGAETGSVLLDLVVASPVGALLLWLALQALQVRKGQIQLQLDHERNRRLGIGTELLEAQAKIGKAAADRLVERLAKDAPLEKALPPEEEERLRKLIRDTSSLYAKDVQFLESVTSTTRREDGPRLDMKTYKEIEGMSEPMLLPETAESGGRSDD